MKWVRKKVQKSAKKYQKVSKSVEKVRKSVKKVSKSVEKVSKKFEKISHSPWDSIGEFTEGTENSIIFNHGLTRI